MTSVSSRYYNIDNVLTTKGKEIRLFTSLQLNYREFIDLDQYKLDAIMDNLVGENKKPSEFRPNNLGQTGVSGPYTTMLGTGSSRFDQNPNGSPFTDNSLDPSFSSEMQAESNHYFQQVQIKDLNHYTARPLN